MDALELRADSCSPHARYTIGLLSWRGEGHGDYQQQSSLVYDDDLEELGCIRQARDEYFFYVDDGSHHYGLWPSRLWEVPHRIERISLHL